MNKHFARHGLAAIASVFLAGCAVSSAPEVRIALDSARTSMETGSSLAKGRALFALGEYGIAIETFRLAVREAPDGADGYNGLAAAYDMLGRFDLSGIYYEMALARAPTDGRIYRNMARSLKMQGRTRESEALLAEWDGLQSHEVAAPPVAPDARVALAEPLGPAIPAVGAGPAEGATMPRARVLSKAAEFGLQPLPPGQSLTRGTPPLSGTRVTIILDPPAPAVARAYEEVRIMNANGRKGIARRMQGYLARSGIRNTRIGDSNRRFGYSWLVYPRGAQDQALAVKKRLPFATNIAIDNRATRVVLLLGRNAKNYDTQHFGRGDIS
jgi:tetratricopeptide (TPR) repeat protein